MQPIVMKMAIGSLEPLSISIVATSFCGSETPPIRNTAKTAAASVEPTMLPSSKPSHQENPNTHMAASAVRTDVTSTPTVANESAGFQTCRTASSDVPRPPSNKIKTSATVPMACASS